MANGAEPVTGRREPVSRATRHAFREVATGTVLRDIEGMWEDEGFEHGPIPDDIGGERRSLYQACLNAVDWTDPGQVSRAVRVFEQTAHGYEAQSLESAYKCLARDGYRVTEEGRIAGGGVGLPERSLAALTDPSAIREGLVRIQGAVYDDPPLAIGGAKELIESTAKVVLHERGRTVDEKATFHSASKKRRKRCSCTRARRRPGLTAATPSGGSWEAPSPWRSEWPSCATVATAPATDQREPGSACDLALPSSPLAPLSTGAR